MIKYLALYSMLIFSMFGQINSALGDSKMDYVYERVTWKAKPGVSDSDMVAAVDRMVDDLKQVDGFLNQTLYKDKNDQWVDIYYWKTEQNAIDSNGAMAEKESFKQLIQLIEPESVAIDIMAPLQSSGKVIFQ